MHHDPHSEQLKGLKRKATDSPTSEFESDDFVEIKKNKHCRASKAKWTAEEDETLTRAVVVNGEGNWKKIAQSLHDRSHLQCLHRWQKVLNPALVKGPWKEEEDNTLTELVEKYGAKDWSSIASHIQGRIGKQCRERWFNHLSPEVRKTNWSSEEDRIIIEAHHRLGNKWTAISKLLDGRPANAIKNHWNSTLLKRIQDENGESPVRRERKKPKIVRAIQATDDSDSESISSDCSSPESSPRFSTPLILAPLPIPPSTQYMATPSFLPQATVEIPHAPGGKPSPQKDIQPPLVGAKRPCTAAMDPDAVARAFVDHYYQTFDSNRAALGNLYQESSMLTFEGAKTAGAQAIVAKLAGLPFQQCAHHISTIDCQPSGPAGGMLVFVSGSLQLAGEQHALKFSQMFHLMPTPQGSFYVLNDIFRLNYA